LVSSGTTRKVRSVRRFCNVRLPGAIKPAPWLRASACALALLASPLEAASEKIPSIAELLSAPDEERLAWAYQLEQGDGVPRQIDLAIHLFCSLAWNGHPKAAFELGWIYLSGRDLPKDEVRGMAWINESATLADPPARRLGKRPSDNTPTQPDCVVPDRVGNWTIWTPADAVKEDTLAGLTQEMAPRYGLDPSLVLAIIEVESAFDPRAISSKGAQGLMQLMPATSTRFGVQDPFDPVQNLAGGMAYLRWLLKQFRGNLPKALASYNAGEHAVARHGGIPPYPETQDYVKKVLTRYQQTLGLL